MSEGSLSISARFWNAWKAELMSEVDRTLNTMQDESTALPMSMTEQHRKKSLRLKLRTRDRERKLIRKIEQSIEAIQNEDYGFC